MPSGTGICDRRIYPSIQGRFRDWRFAAGLLRERKASLRRTHRDWIYAKNSPDDSHAARALEREELLVCRGSTRGAAQRDLGQAGASCRGRIFNMDARQSRAAGGVQRSARRQACRRSGAGNSGCADRGQAIIAGAEKRETEWPAPWKGSDGDEGAAQSRIPTRCWIRKAA